MRHRSGESIETFKEKLSFQRKRLLIGGIVFLTLLFLIVGFYLYDIKKQSDAKELEAEAYKYYFGVVRELNLSQEQRFFKSAQLFVEAYDKKKNITYLLNAGYSYDMAGKKDEAIEILNKVANIGDYNISNLAKVKIAMIYLRENEIQKAVSKFNEIVNEQSPVMKDFALFQLAKIYEKDKKEESLSYYERLLKNFPHSPFSEVARKMLDSSKKQ
jgi:tetratricopeptide (TPR) repeat protein